MVDTLRPDLIWMACYHDTNSMNEKQEETAYPPILYLSFLIEKTGFHYW